MLHRLIHHSIFIKERTPYSVWYAISFIIGILWQANYLNSLTAVVIMLTISMCLASLKHIFYEKLPLFCIFLLGAWRYLSHDHHIKTILYQIGEKSISLKAKVIDNNDISTSSRAAPRTLLVSVVSAHNAYTNQSLDLKDVIIQLHAHQNSALSHCQYGDIITIDKIWIQKTTHRMLHVLQRRNAVASAFVGTKQICTVQKEPLPSWLSYCHKLKHNLVLEAHAKLSPLAAYLFCSIFLGFSSPDNRQSTDWLRTSFSWWGISHYLARSGLHLALLASVTQTSLLILPLGHIIKQILILCLLILYTLLSWPSISFIRAASMILGNILCTFTQIPYNALHALMYTTIVLLAYNPLYLMSIEFQLSFFITLGLILSRHAKLIRQNTT